MSSPTSILEDQSKLSLADRTFFKLESFLNLMGGVIIFMLVFLATTNALGRWLFDLPISGYIDWVEQSMAFMAFLGIAYTKREGGHIRMDMLVSRLHGRRLWLVELFSSVVMLIITVALIYGSYLHFLRSYTLGDSSLDIDLPTWPAKLVVPFALTILALRIMLQIWGYSRAAFENNNQPVAVPLIEDAAAVAAKEAEALIKPDLQGDK
ncbi:MAG: TRAP transporter small permease [Gammaproteobacteria bacterium]|nr:TRAP transporter small permease [Gammaproteobacteria bacterium]